MTSKASVHSDHRLPDPLARDIEELRRKVEQLESGALSGAEFRAYRVPQGIYEQRTSETFMLRVRLVAGVISPEQMRVVAEVAETYGDGTLHLTSRQDVQVHGAKMAGLYPALVKLAQAGLSTKGGGGNTVRNITACHQSGVCAEEVFDVTSHVVNLTEFLLPDPLSYQLPRKFKIACSGCSLDCAGATINDLGFISKQRDGEEGFAVYVGGGMGAQSQVGRLLENFIPAARACHVAEAIKRVFDTHGNRKNKHRARIRFLVDDIGFEAFRKLYRDELDQVRDLVTPQAHEVTGGPARQGGHTVPPVDGFDYWRQVNVSPQKQTGYHTVEISAPLGVFQADEMRLLADVVDRYGEAVLRATKWQNFALRWVSEADLPVLHAELFGLGLGTGEPPILRHLVTCAGASTCRLGVCLSRGLTTAIRKALNESDLDLRDGIGHVRIHISGCPNSCGRHLVAHIGLSGMARRVNGRLVPHYTIHLGGHVAEGETVLATGTNSIPARNVPGFLVELLQSFDRSRQRPDFAAFLAADGRQIAETLCRRHALVPDFATDKNYYFDWGAEEIFSLAGRGPGECGAGVFDLIQVDLASASEALEVGRLFSATVLAARAMLVTRGEQADTDRQSLELFRRHFVEPEVVSADFMPLIVRAQKALVTANPETVFEAREEEVADLLAAVEGVYESLGPSLRVAAPKCVAPVATSVPAAKLMPADVTKDFRAVVCPLNYVKTKMALEKIETGQILAVLLDEKGAEKVPASVASDGHEILAVTRDHEHWRVVIRKAK